MIPSCPARTRAAAPRTGRRAAAVGALLWSVAVAACGGGSAAVEGPQKLAPSSLEGALAELDAAEARLAGLGPAAGATPSAEPLDPAGRPQPAPTGQPATLSTGATCESACDALGSMRRAVDHVCALDEGERCENAKGRLARAEARVRSACPACEESP